MLRSIVLAAMLACGVAACNTTEQRIGGAAVGAGTGAVVGGPVGAVVGGAVGAVTGPTVVRETRRVSGRRYVRRHRYHAPSRQG